MCNVLSSPGLLDVSKTPFVPRFVMRLCGHEEFEFSARSLACSSRRVYIPHILVVRVLRSSRSHYDSLVRDTHARSSKRPRPRSQKGLADSLTTTRYNIIAHCAVNGRKMHAEVTLRPSSVHICFTSCVFSSQSLSEAFAVNKTISWWLAWRANLMYCL